MSASPKDSERSHTRGRAADGVEANARLTGSTAAVLFVLLAAEGVTILRVRPLLSWHVFIGMLLVPPVALKIGTTSYRFVRYYRGSPAYRRKGPPPQLLRLLGPFVVVLTFVVLASGIALLLVPPSQRRSLLFLHKASFVLWFGAMAIHVVGHFVDTAKLAPHDWFRRSHHDVAGAGIRQWVLVSSLGAGVLLGLLLLGQASPWLTSSGKYEGHAVRSHHRQPPQVAGRTPRIVGSDVGQRTTPTPVVVPATESPAQHAPAPSAVQAPTAVPQRGSASSRRATVHRGKHRKGSRSHRSGSTLGSTMSG